ncbi:MAG: NfeD family protein, partial [Shewanella sp.]
GGDSHVDNTDEELEIYNQIAHVKQTIGPGQTPGRVEFQGSEWPALGDGSVIAVGSQVRIICRENIALVVEPVLQDIS